MIHKLLRFFVLALMLILSGVMNAQISSLADITDPQGSYILSSSFTPTGTAYEGGDPSGAVIGTSTNPFKGTIDGQLVTITGTWSNPLFDYIEDAIIKNVIIGNASVSTSGNAGAIASNALGASRIYNCGILDGSVGGSNAVGGFVGLLDGTSRVINCYSYATITGGTDVAGIVGKNNATTTAASINTMVMNCMFYGDITGGTNVSPVYGGTIINNLNSGGLNNFNYYAYDKLKTRKISSGKYNCALAVEEKYLNRIEFYRLLLNSNKKLAAYYASTTSITVNPYDMAKWVLETADRNVSNPKPYPILKDQGTSTQSIKYPSIINFDATHAPDSSAIGPNKGGVLGKTLSVTINSVGSNAPNGATITKGSLTLVRTDKDFDRFNFNYDKVQLPYYNDVGTMNYTGNKVVTGWKITSISTVAGDPYGSGNYNYQNSYASNPEYFDTPNYNFADRKSSQKDLYSVSGRVFSQGAYFDVPYGVTSITIEPYWGNAAYVADEYLDVVCKVGKVNNRNAYIPENVTQLGKTFQNGKITIDGSEQTVNTSVSNAINGFNTTSSVYDQAVVLVGNLHLQSVPSGGDKPFTMMSVDLDKDNEPDCSLIYCDNDRRTVCPLRFDFLNIPGTAQAQKPNDASVMLNAAIFRTKGWLEITNTALMYFSQFEYENQGTNSSIIVTKSNAPLILQGGYIDQFVSAQSAKVDGKTIYIHLGGNVLINSFGMGTHSDGSKKTPHVPVSVTGGDFLGFYLSGTYNQNAEVYDDNAECYISGGRFTELAGASQEQIGANTTTKGNVNWQIYNADITDFFGGGVNDAKPVKGNITTEIFNSRVGTFCGGPKFGNMAAGKKVTTKAQGCTFDRYFGAGYGGNSYSRKKYFDATSYTWTTLQGYYTGDRGKYYDGSSTGLGSGNQYGFKGPGVATDFDYEFFVWTSGAAGVRFFVKFASFSLAQCNDVESTLKGCTINENFYGGGSLGKVIGTATSVLEDCIVKGNAYGAGYSATLPKIPVRQGGFEPQGNSYAFPNFNASSGMFEPGTPTDTTHFTWKQVSSYPANGSAGFMKDDGTYSIQDGTNVVTTVDITKANLGSVSNAILTLKGTTTVGTAGDNKTGDVFGGGDESAVDNNSTVILEQGVTVLGDVYGGGNEGAVGIDATVQLVDGASMSQTSHVTVNGSVFGGGNKANVGGNSTVLIDQDNASIAADVYGGGALADVGDDANDQTIVNILGGTINGNVYGGGLGDDTHEPAVNGVVTVNIGTVDNTDPDNPVYSGDAIINGSVFGCNNANGSPTDNVTVNIYKTHRTTAQEITGEGFALSQVFGGGNQANYEPAADKVATVHVWSCDNTIQYVYGGGNAADLGTTSVNSATEVIIDGGRIEWVFGGGNGFSSTGNHSDPNAANYNPGANINGNTNVTYHGGDVTYLFGGSNQYGDVSGTKAVDILADGSCSVKHIAELYGGSNEAPTNGNVSLTMGCPDHLFEIGAIFGGSRNADIDGNVTLNIVGGQYDKVFGGNNMGGTITGDVTLNLYGGYINNAFGGNNASGQINGKIIVNVLDDESKDANDDPTCPLVLHNVYGGGYDASYHPTATEATTGNYPEVNIIHGTVSTKTGTQEGTTGNVFGGGYGTTAVVQSHPKVRVGYDASMSDYIPSGYPVAVVDRTAVVDNNVYGGGDLAAVDGSTTVLLQHDNSTVSRLFGGGNKASVGSATVTVDGGTVGTGVYGGCNTSGEVAGKITVNVNGGSVGSSGQLNASTPIVANVFGGGYGANTSTADDIEVNIGANPDVHDDYPKIYGDVYGGSAFGNVNSDASHTTIVNVVNGTLYSNPVSAQTSSGQTYYIYRGGNVYGGGLGRKDDNSTTGVDEAIEAKVFGKVIVNIGAPDDTRALAPESNVGEAILGGSVYGCNNTNGSPQDEVTVNIYKTYRQPTDEHDYSGTEPATFAVNNVFGGGNEANYLPSSTSVNKSVNVLIHGCYNSIERVFGGSNAAAAGAVGNTVAVETNIDGGRFRAVFGGGNGEVSPADIYGSANLLIHGGIVDEFFVGSNQQGTITGNSSVDIDPTSGCETLIINEFFCGGKYADIVGNIETSIDCSDGLNVTNLYGGCKEANVTGNVHLSVYGGHFENVFGGSKGDLASLGDNHHDIAANIGGNVILDLYGGTITNVFGGSNVNGNIGGTITVNVRDEENPSCPLNITNIYGGSNLTSYSPNDPNVTSPVVNMVHIKHGIQGNVYGGSKGVVGTTATLKSNPQVNIGYDEATMSNLKPSNYNSLTNWHRVIITGSVFGGGDAAKVDGNTTIFLRNDAKVFGNVYGGGNLGEVSGNTKVIVNGEQGN